MAENKQLNIEIAAPMKYKIYYIFGLLLFTLLLGNSCRVASLQQFYCKDDIISIPEELIGKWQSSDFNLIFYKNRANISSCMEKPEPKPTELDTVFFKIDNIIFLDVWMNHDEKLDYPSRGYFVIPCHALFRIDFKDNELTATPFNYEWICEQIKQGKIEIPNVIVKNPKDDNDRAYIFTASPEQWKVILKKYTSDSEAFKYPQEFKRALEKKE